MNETTPEVYRERRKRLAALCRTGGFVQVRRSLCRGSNCFCPLGLACEQYRRETGLGYWGRRGITLNDKLDFVCPTEDGTGHHHRDSTMPPPVCDYFGFVAGEGSYVDPHTGDPTTVVGRADTDKLTIRGFADMLEDPPEGLFRPSTL